MTSTVTRISRPGWTGNLGALRIVKAVQRTLSSVDPIGHRSMVVTSCNVDSPTGSSMLHIFSPVSVGLRNIETGGENWRNVSIHGLFIERSSVQKPTKPPPARRNRSRLRSQSPDPRLMQCRSLLGDIWSADRSSLSCSAVRIGQPLGRATSTQRGRRLLRLLTNRTQDRSGTGAKALGFCQTGSGNGLPIRQPGMRVRS